MTETLSTLNTRPRAVLDDPDGDRFSDDQITQAIRNALHSYGALRPRAVVENLNATGDKDISLASLSNPVESVFRVIYNSTDLAFYRTIRNGVPWITLSTAVASGETLTIHYVTPHTLTNLDSATSTTFEDYDADGIALAAAAFALRSRANSRTESNNLNPDTAQNLRNAAENYMDAFFSAFPPIRGAAAAYWTLDTQTDYEPNANHTD